MIKDKLNLVSEKEYRAHPALSYSFLKELDNGPKVILNGMKNISGAGLTLGSFVDNKITIEDYDWQDDFIMTEHALNFTGGTAIDDILKYIYDNPEYPTDEDSMLDLAEKLGKWSKMGREPKLKRIFCEKFNSSIMIMKELRAGKSLLLQSDYELGMTMIETLKSHRFTRDIFTPDYEEELIFQLPIFFKINGTECKSLLDMVTINHDKKRIYPRDLKTGANSSLLKNFYQYKYFYQAGMYTLAIRRWAKHVGLGDYEIMPFEFIYIGRPNPDKPQRFVLTEDYIENCINGYTNKYGDYVPGVLDLITDYKWYIKNDVYDVKRSIHEANGVQVIRNNNI